MIAADSTVTIGVAVLANLLVTAFLVGRRHQKIESELVGLRKDFNGLGGIVRADRVAEEFRSLTAILTTLVTTEGKEERRWLVDKFLNGFRRP